MRPRLRLRLRPRLRLRASRLPMSWPSTKVATSAVAGMRSWLVAWKATTLRCAAPTKVRLFCIV